MDTTAEVSNKTRIIFFDGVCNLCNSSVNYVIDHDKKKKFSFASLQSDLARDLLGNLGVDSQKLESIVLKKGDKIYRKSSAAIEIAREMDGLWPVLYVFKLVPAFVRDFIYDFIAKNRYRWFGKQDSCRMPTPELKERFLDSYNVS